MNSSNTNLKTKLLVALLLVFAGVFDLLVGQLLLHTSLGLAPIFMACATVFILQDLFQWVRLGLLVLMGAVVLYRVFLMIGNLDVILSNLFFMMTRPAAIPLYSVLLFIGILTFLILKTNRIIQHNK